MPNVSVFDVNGKKVSDIELADGIFGIEPNTSAMHLVVVNYLANQRQGTQSTLTRSEVSGGGKKPWRQKGTGRARQGSTRSPQWTHGGVALGPKPRTYKTDLNKKVKRLALKSALSSKVADDSLVIVNAIVATEYKTKVMANMLNALGATGKTLVVLSEKNDMVVKSLSNIAGVKTAYVNTINVYDILNCDKLVIVEAAAKKIEEVYA
jgi:large subunit ribosomal protein L4